MGHRASIAYVGADGTVRAHYSHWGALELRLAFDDGMAITKRTPLGGHDPTPDFAKAVIGALSASEFENVEDNMPTGTDVEPEPYWVGDSLEAWAREAVDYLFHEAAYVVEKDGDEWSVRAFDTVMYRDGDNEDGVLVEVFEPDEWNTYSGMTWDDEFPNTDSLDDFVAAVIDRLEEIDERDRVPSFSRGADR